MFSVSADADLLEAIVGPVPARLRRASLSRILDSSECELAQLGLGESARRRVLACAEVARRCQPRVAERARVTSPREALVHLEPLRRQSREALAVLLLDARLHACGLRLVALGGVSRVGAGPSEVFRPALKAQASAVVIAHNHPSGESDPSEADANFTAAMIAAGQILGIEVLDHIIVTRRGYYSFSEAGRLGNDDPIPASVTVPYAAVRAQQEGVSEKSV